MYDVNTDELLFELFCQTVYDPHDVAELRRKYDGLSNRGKANVRKAYEALGRLLDSYERENDGSSSR